MRLYEDLIENISDDLDTIRLVLGRRIAPADAKWKVAIEPLEEMYEKAKATFEIGVTDIDAIKMVSMFLGKIRQYRAIVAQRNDKVIVWWAKDWYNDNCADCKHAYTSRFKTLKGIEASARGMQLIQTEPNLNEVREAATIHQTCGWQPYLYNAAKGIEMYTSDGDHSIKNPKALPMDIAHQIGIKGQQKNEIILKDCNQRNHETIKTIQDQETRELKETEIDNQ
jgi:hypothetical protein